jgi:hypothetical protein
MSTTPHTQPFPVSQNNQLNTQQLIAKSSTAHMSLGWERIMIMVMLLLFAGDIFSQEGVKSSWELLKTPNSVQNETSRGKISNSKNGFNNWDTLVRYSDSKAFHLVSPGYFPEIGQAGFASSSNPGSGNIRSLLTPAYYAGNLSYKPNQIFIAPAYLEIANSGQGVKGYGSFGVTGEYTRFITPRIGATLDAGIYFHKETQDGLSINYNSFNITAGPTFIPFNNPWSADTKLTGNLHALVGLSSIMIKQSSGSYVDNFSKQGFTAVVGGALDYHINPTLGIRVQADYTPTFFFNTTQNNARISAGVIIGFGGGKAATIATTDSGRIVVDSVPKKQECKASGITKELKINLYAIQKAADALEKVLMKIPRVKEAKALVSPQLTVKRGEECCAMDQPPVTYTELKGGVDGTATLTFNAWGIPDIKEEIELWAVKLKLDIECGIYVGATGKVSLVGVGKFFGELGQTDRPDCKACYYLNFKLEAFLKAGGIIKGAIGIYHWTPFGKGKGGYDAEPDEEVEVSADVSASFGATTEGTYASEDCSKPKPGLHGELVLGKAKANVKVKVKLGPLSFEPSLEVPICDGVKFNY